MSNLTPQRRKTWEEANPILAHQEFELNDYIKRLSTALLLSFSPNHVEDDDEDTTPHTSSPLNSVPESQWVEAERQLQSLEAYVKEHPIISDRVKATGIDAFLKQILNAMQQLDEVGINRSAVDEGRAGRVWGLADKIGSGLSYLLRVDRRWKESSGDARPTTKSVFLLVSAPPATMSFVKDKSEWRTKQLKDVVKYFNDYIFESEMEKYDEYTWSVVWKELGRCKKAVVGGFSKENLEDSGIIEMLGKLSGKIKELVSKSHESGRSMEEMGMLYLDWDMVTKLLAHLHGDRVDWES